jgi:hypothetical protein
MPTRNALAHNGPISRGQNLSNLIGDRGERIFELAITDYTQFKKPLFRPGFLGEKWPTIDYYVELLGVRGYSPFFFAQIKATTEPISEKAERLEINVSHKKCDLLFRVPGPTYIVGVNEPNKKAYILSMHEQPGRGVYSIPVKYELTPDNLTILHKEVCDFWKSFPRKPMESHFR